MIHLHNRTKEENELGTLPVRRFSCRRRCPVVLITVAQAEHGLDDGDMVALDDMRGSLETYNGQQLKVKRVAIASPVRTTHNLYILLICMLRSFVVILLWLLKWEVENTA